MENTLKPVITSASISASSKRKNEDAAAHFVLKDSYHIAVADGVGSASHAKEASEFVTKKYQHLCKKQPSSAKNIYTEINRLLSEQFTHSEDGYETTLITLQQNLSEGFHINYVGNGCIFHLKGNFWQQKTSSQIPWNITNYLAPHSLLENGKEVLYNYFSNHNQQALLPTSLQVSADPYFGDIFILGTDGFHSEDQKKAGKNKSGTWEKFPEILLIFFEGLSTFFTENEVLNKAQLQLWLEKFLNSQQKKQLLEDDTSIAILISGTALKFHQKHKEPH